MEQRVNFKYLGKLGKTSTEDYVTLKMCPCMIIAHLLFLSNLKGSSRDEKRVDERRDEKRLKITRDLDKKNVTNGRKH